MWRPMPSSSSYGSGELSDQFICGVDEVGRGPLAGAVVAAAVILDPLRPVAGLADSKKLSERRRERLYGEITACALAWAVGRAEVDEIDQLNILHASLLAMCRAVAALPITPTGALIDGNRVPNGLACPARAIVGGDATEPSISAASIIAKVTRDREMTALHERYPGYGFDSHKGYPTRQHLAALVELGPLQIHRRSFGPVAKVLNLKNNKL